MPITSYCLSKAHFMNEKWSRYRTVLQGHINEKVISIKRQKGKERGKSKEWRRKRWKGAKGEGRKDLTLLLSNILLPFALEHHPPEMLHRN